jgi:hypothetical protein
VSLHETPALSYCCHGSYHGRTRTLVLPAGEVAAVAAAIERYRAAVAELKLMTFSTRRARDGCMHLYMMTSWRSDDRVAAGRERRWSPPSLAKPSARS